MSRSTLIILGVVCGLWAAAARAQVAPADRCEALKLQAVGKYERCRFKAEAQAVIHKTAPDFAGCAAAFVNNWAKADRRAHGECTGERRDVNQLIQEHVNEIKLALSVGLGVCGNGVIEGNEQCDGSALGGEDCTSLGFLLGTLACSTGCTFDVSGCTRINCDPLAQDCALGQGCYLFLGCQSAGTKDVGASCLLQNECRPGLACILTTVAGAECVKLCDLTNPSAICSGAQTCVDAGLLADPDVGTCQP